MNHMKEVAALLGVELKERFKIIDYNCKEIGTYKLTEDGLLQCSEEYDYIYFVDTSSTITYLLTGADTIKKIPFKPKLTLEEKVILSVLPKEYEWIVRDERIGNLLLYKDKPYKSEKRWASSSMKNWNYFDLFNHLFQFIKWTDKEPVHIPTLLKDCEVVEND